MPSLPTTTLGAPPRRPPGAIRPAPRNGGIQGMGVPPDLRRRAGAVRAAPGAAAVVDGIRAALGKAQGKLLESQQKLQLSAVVLRAKLAARKVP